MWITVKFTNERAWRSYTHVYISVFPIIIHVLMCYEQNKLRTALTCTDDQEWLDKKEKRRCSIEALWHSPRALATTSASQGQAVNAGLSLDWTENHRMVGCHDTRRFCEVKKMHASSTRKLFLFIPTSWYSRFYRICVKKCWKITAQFPFVFQEIIHRPASWRWDSCQYQREILVATQSSWIVFFYFTYCWDKCVRCLSLVCRDAKLMRKLWKSN